MSRDELIELARRQNILISSMASQFSELLEVNEALEGEHAKQIAELTAMNSDLAASIGCVVLSAIKNFPQCEGLTIT